MTYRPLTFTAFRARAGSILLGDSSDFAVTDRDVADCAELVFGIDDVAALQKKIVRGSFILRQTQGGDREEQQERRSHDVR